MERLKNFTALALILTAAAPVYAESNRYTVAGDVPNPHVREYPEGEYVSAQRLLRDSGVDSDGSAVIVRGSQPQAYTEYVYADSAGETSFLLPGDVVVFHHSQGTRSAAGNVVVSCATSGVVTLSQEGNQLGSLLSQLRIEFGAETTCRVVRTATSGPKSLILAPHDALAHGDVLILDDGLAVDEAYLESLFTAAGKAEAAAGENIRAEPDTDINSSAAPTERPAGLMIPADGAVPATADSDEADIPVSLAALETVLPPAGDVTPPVTSAAAGVPPVGSPVSAGASVSPIWNGVFLVGLFGSLLLVVTGWIKTQRERAVAGINESESAYQLRSPEELPAVEQPIVASWPDDATLEEVSVASEIASHTDDFPSTEESVAPAELSITDRLAVDRSTRETGSSGKQLVQESEWYGDEWRTAAEPAEGKADESEPTAEEHSELLPLVSSVPEPVSVEAAESTSIHTEQAEASVVAAADDLEDLIQNRLPVQLCEADLPLRVTLFGRPAGPRRLRIDNSHKELAAPHFSAASRVNSQPMQKVEAVETVSGDQAQDQASLDRALHSLHGQGH